MEIHDSQVIEECVTTTIVSNEEVLSIPSEQINSGERNTVFEKRDFVRDKPLTFDGRIIWLQAEPVEFETIECDQEVEITTSESYCALEEVRANGGDIYENGISTEACEVLRDMPTVEITADMNFYGLDQIIEVETEEIIINNKGENYGKTELGSDEDLEDALEEINYNNSSDPTVDSGIGMLRCISCQSQYRTSRDIWDHARKSATLTRSRTEPVWKKYICCKCGYTTDRIWSLKTHVIAIHEERKPYSCSHCQYSCMDISELRSHLRSMHRKERPYACHECDFRTPASNTLKRHIMLRHRTKKPYHCQFCDFTATTSSALKCHVCSAHSKEKPYKCGVCSFKANDFDVWKTHILFAHGVNKQPKLLTLNSGANENSKSNTKTKAGKERSTKQFNCTLCSYSTTRNASLEVHLATKHNEGKVKVQSMLDYGYSCSYCEYKTNKPDNLKRHVESKHSSQSEQECPFCGFRASSYGGLRRHTKAVHLKKKYYVCSYCNFSASLPSDLENHVVECHQNEKKEHRCHQCMYSSDTSTELTNHIVSEHLKPSRGLCPFCELRDDNADRLAYHIRTEHAKQKMYRCPHCDFSCTTEEEIQSHNITIHNLTV